MELQNMDLRTYLFLKNMTLKSFSETLNYSTAQISQVMHGRRKPGRKLARLIEQATNGEIKAEELLKDKEETDG